MNFYVSHFQEFEGAITFTADPMAGFHRSFELDGQEFMALERQVRSSSSTNRFSMFVNCEDQAEVDYFWNKLIADGGESHVRLA